ncbi:helix-turn-helix domain-containing protein [Psychroserpens sp. BH13MA-6]
MIGSIIKKIRELKGYSQEFLADQLNISQSAYSDLENDKSKVHLERLYKIALVLDVEITEFIISETSRSVDKENDFSCQHMLLELKRQYESQLKEKDEMIQFLKMQLLKK